MSHNDYEKEPIPGLPEKLPDGENLVWQGTPDRTAFSKHVLRVWFIVVYFAALIIWRIGAGIYDGVGVTEIAVSVVWAMILCSIVLMLSWWFARAVEKTTIYTITNKRVVMRFGVALPITFNYPFSQIVAADVRNLSNGSGTIALTLAEHTKISWPILWPHVRPWKLAKPQPAFRAIADVGKVAEILAENLASAHGLAATTPVVVEKSPTNTRPQSASPQGTSAMGTIRIERS